MTARSRPSSLAASIARSAERISVAVSAPCFGWLATPVGLRQQQGELVAADAGGAVGASLPLDEVTRDQSERRIAGRLPAALVERGEAVEVAEQYRDRAPGAPGALQLERDKLVEGAPVEE